MDEEEGQLRLSKRRKSDGDGEWRPCRAPLKRGLRTTRRPARSKPVVPSPRTLPPEPGNTTTSSKPGELSCSEPGCYRLPFADKASLDAHVKKKHTRPYACAFHFAGCQSTFATKNEWKPHVSSQHLLLNYWLCQEDECAKLGNVTIPRGADPKWKGPTKMTTGSKTSASSSPSATPPEKNIPNGAIFNRKDLYTRHMRRMHMPGHFKKKNMSSALAGLKKTTSENGELEWESPAALLPRESATNEMHASRVHEVPSRGMRSRVMIPAICVYVYESS